MEVSFCNDLVPFLFNISQSVEQIKKVYQSYIMYDHPLHCFTYLAECVQCESVCINKYVSFSGNMSRLGWGRWGERERGCKYRRKYIILV
jgi:hypothetical protein